MNPFADTPILDSLQVKSLLKQHSDKRGRISRLLKSDTLIQLRRGLYASRNDLHPMCFGSSIYGPSYISFASALSWHGLIPEGVHEITSATLKRPKVFENQYGRYRYIRIPPDVFSIGITMIRDADVPFLMASVTKAICDTIAREPGMRSILEVKQWLQAMRIEDVPQLDSEELSQCAEGYRKPSVRWLKRAAEKNDWIKQ